MEITQIMILVILMGSLQGLILAFILTTKDGFKKKSNIFLALFILAFSLSNFHYLAHIFGLIEKYSWLNYLSFPWTFLIPVVFYLFIIYLLNPEHILSKRDRCLFVLFGIQLLFHIVLFVLDISDSNKLVKYESAISFVDGKVETVLSLVLNLIFIPIVYKTLSSYELILKDNYSEISESSVEWLKRLVAVLIGIWILWAFPALYQIFTGITTPLLDLILWSLMSVCIYWIGYATYFKNDIFHAKRTFPSQISVGRSDVSASKSLNIDNSPSIDLSEPTLASIKDNTSLKEDAKDVDKASLKVDKLSEHYSSVIHHLESDRLYTDPNFSLSMLSDRCGLSSNYLSQIISKKTEGNFYSLINGYRVEAVKRMMASSEFDQYTLLSIGLEAGFKSKSSFYKIFKEQTRLTPSQYKKTLATSISDSP